MKPTEGEPSLFTPLGSADALPRGRAKVIFKGGCFLQEKVESRGHWPTAVTLRMWDRSGRVPAGTMVGLALS